MSKSLSELKRAREVRARAASRAAEIRRIDEQDEDREWAELNRRAGSVPAAVNHSEPILSGRFKFWAVVVVVLYVYFRFGGV